MTLFGFLVHRYALVAGSNHRLLWILAREPSLDPETIARLRERAEAAGFDLSGLIFVEHDRTYPIR